jgi:hypothetical protein
MTVAVAGKATLENSSARGFGRALFLSTRNSHPNEESESASQSLTLFCQAMTILHSIINGFMRLDSSELLAFRPS